MTKTEANDEPNGADVGEAIARLHNRENATAAAELEQLDGLIQTIQGQMDKASAEIGKSDSELHTLTTKANREHMRGKLLRVRYNVLATRLETLAALRAETAVEL